MSQGALFSALDNSRSGHGGLHQRRRMLQQQCLQQLAQGPWWPFPASRGLIACAPGSSELDDMPLDYLRPEQSPSGAWNDPASTNHVNPQAIFEASNEDIIENRLVHAKSGLATLQTLIFSLRSCRRGRRAPTNPKAI